MKPSPLFREIYAMWHTLDSAALDGVETEEVRNHQIAKSDRVLGLQRTPQRNPFVAFSIRGKSSPRMVVMTVI